MGTPATPQPSLGKIFVDPDFQRLSPGDQNTFLRHFDPGFQSLPEQDLEHFKQKFQESMVPGSGQTGLPGISKPPQPFTPRDAFFADPKEQAKGKAILGSPELTELPSAADTARYLKVPASVLPAVAAGSTAAKFTPGGPIPKSIVGATAAAATYLPLHGALQRVQNYLSGENEEDTPLTDLAVNEAGGAAIKGVMKVGKAVLPPTMEALAKLSPTFSQFASSPEAGGVANLLSKGTKYVEDLFAPGAKGAAVSNSGRLASGEIADQASQLSGRAKSTVQNPHFFAQKIQTEDLQNAYKVYTDQSNKQAGIVNLFAEGAPQVVQSTTPVISQDLEGLAKSQTGKKFANLPSEQQTAVLDLAKQAGIQPYDQAATQRVVKGPIQLNGTLQKAKALVDSTKDLKYGPTPDSVEGLNVASRLLNSTNAKFDPQTGGLLSADPVGFREAWDLKQHFGENTDFGGGKLTQTEKAYKDLFHSMNDDIESSIPSWDQNKQAINAWRNSKATVEERNLTFAPKGSDVPTLDKIIDKSSSPLPSIEATLADPVALQRALNSGKVKFPSGDVYANNTRQDLGAARLQQIWEKGFDQTKGTVNAGQVQNAFNDPRFFEQNKMLYSQQSRDNINELLKNVALTQEKPSASWVNKVLLTRAGLALTPTLFGLATGSLVHTGEVALGELGMSAVGHALVNPTIARGLINLTSGKALGMSEAAFARRVASAIQGSAIALTGTDGSQTKGTIDKDGKFTAEKEP